MSLPAPTAAARAHAALVTERIQAEIAQNDGWIGFDRYMELALYAPGLGYYMAGARKLGPEGDFITAPELTPLFGHTLAQLAADVIASGLPDILEIGAGSGALAASILEALERSGTLPEHYQILELSPDLRERSRDTLRARVPQLLDRVVWLNQLPPTFRGLVLGNEVLDAMPVRIVHVGQDGVEEAGVGLVERPSPSSSPSTLSRFGWVHRPAGRELIEFAKRHALASPYTTEVAPIGQGFIASIAAMLDQGVAVFIDYGFPAREYFHPQRNAGTLMCHYRHRAHADPFLLPGLQDITAHVDFSAVATAAAECELLGYTSQASFLIDRGLTELLSDLNPEDPTTYLPITNAVQRLVSPAEMGELFKVIAFGRGWASPLRGFRRGDRSATL